MATELPDFIEKLRDNQLWWMRMLEMYPQKDHLQITQEVHLFLLASPERFNTGDYSDFRRLYQTWASKHKSEIRKPVVVTEQPPIEAEIVKHIPRGTPEYKARVKEVLDAIAGVGRPVAPMTKQEEEENGQVRPKAHKFTQSPTVKSAAINKHQQLLNDSRRKFFLDAFPDATEEEIQSYIDSFPI